MKQYDLMLTESREALSYKVHGDKVNRSGEREIVIEIDRELFHFKIKNNHEVFLHRPSSSSKKEGESYKKVSWESALTIQRDLHVRTHGFDDFLTLAEKNHSGKNGRPDNTSPMPGKVLKILVTVGERVKAGTPLVIIEAMKMEHTLKANSDAIIQKILVSPLAQVKSGQVLLELSQEES
jgi:biotin carboxyl carrier protein